MNLPNFLQAVHFNSLRSQMGAELSTSFETNYIYNPIELPILKRLRGEGIDVVFDDIDVLHDGTLAYKGYRVLVYIRDVNNYVDHLTLPKFHLAYCRTLETMRNNQRWLRYVVANREDGKFLVNIMNEGNQKVMSLDVCQNCLNRISWEGFRFGMSKQSRLQIVKSFSLPHYFFKYPRDQHLIQPEHSSDKAPLNEYPDNWQSISENVKRACGYACSSCRIKLAFQDSRFLHVHHKDGQKNNCSEQNLETLCVECHAKQPMHAHMKASPDYAAFVSTFKTSG